MNGEGGSTHHVFLGTFTQTSESSIPRLGVDSEKWARFFVLAEETFFFGPRHSAIFFEPELVLLSPRCCAVCWKGLFLLEYRVSLYLSRFFFLPRVGFSQT